MKSLKTLISFFIIVVFLVSLAGTVSAKQYIIYHDDEIDTITQLQKNSKDRQHQYVIEDLQDQINELEQQMHEVYEEPTEEDEDDFYDCRREIRKYIRGDEDHDDFMDYLDDHAQCEDYYYDGVWDDDWQDNDWNDYWQYDDDWYDDYADSYDDWYENCKLRPSDYYDNYDYSDYLKDLQWRGKCKKFWDTHRWYDYNTFIEKYENIDTSIDPLWNKYTWENYYSKYPWYEDKFEE